MTTILILFWSSFVLFEFILKGSYIFEGQVTVNEMSFTYNGYSEKPLLKNVIEIKTIDIMGKRTEPLTLRGTFTSNDKNLNQKLSSLDELKINFPYSTSKLILTSNNPDSSLPIDFSILELTINHNTRINQLTYTQENQLSFCLQSATQVPEDCLDPENADNDPNFPNVESLGSLKLSFEIQPYIITLIQVNIPELNITSNDQSLELNYIPQTKKPHIIPTKEPVLSILSPTQIFIDLPELITDKPNSEIEIPQWFYKDLDVTDVKFVHVEQLSQFEDEIVTSTIINGKVRMKDRELELKNNQFLIIADNKPGIRKLRYLSINSLQPKGLQTFISGKSKGIAVGLYREFPIQSIQPSWLSQYFSLEVVAGIISFISAFTAIVLEKMVFPDN